MRPVADIFINNDAAPSLGLFRLRYLARQLEAKGVDYYSSLLGLGRSSTIGLWRGSKDPWCSEIACGIYRDCGDGVGIDGGALAIAPFGRLSLITGWDEWEALLVEVSAKLRPGGRFIFDVEPCHTEDPQAKGVTHYLGAARNESGVEVLLSEVRSIDHARGVMRARVGIESVDESGRVTGKEYKTLVLGLISDKRMGLLASRAGFEVEKHCGDFNGGVPTPSSEVSLWVLRRKEEVKGRGKGSRPD